MELRCKAGGVPVVRMKTNIRLGNPQDELKKRYNQAVVELNQLKNRLPCLSLQLSATGKAMNQGEVCTFELCNTWQPGDIESELASLQQRYPKQAGLHAYGMKMGIVPPVAGMAVSLGQWQEYDKALDSFFAEYREYLEGKDIVASARTRSIALDIWLYNDGKGPATDIDVVLTFPNSICWCAESGGEDAMTLEKDFAPPEPPAMPRPYLLADLQMVPQMAPVANGEARQLYGSFG